MTPLELLQATEIKRLEARVAELEAKISPLDLTCTGETLHQLAPYYIGQGEWGARCTKCQKIGWSNGLGS